MTNQPTPAAIAAQANMLGDPFRVQCKYEWDGPKRRFVWKFYRRGRFIGSTARQDQVMPMMIKFTA